MNMSSQCATAVKRHVKACKNFMLGIISKGIEKSAANIIMPMYKSVVMPLMGKVLWGLTLESRVTHTHTHAPTDSTQKVSTGVIL